MSDDNVVVVKLITGEYVIGKMFEDKLTQTKEVRVVQDIVKGTNGQPVLNAQQQPQYVIHIGLGPMSLLAPNFMPTIEKYQILFTHPTIPDEIRSRYIKLISNIDVPQIKLIKK